jgi:C1A family cysteine protease
MTREQLLSVTSRASDFLSTYISDGLLKERAFDKAPILLADLGAGSGLDTAVSTGSCPAPSSQGIYANFDWKLKQFTTGVKNQGTRGTCWGFAVTAAAELFATQAKGRRVNLSEQEFAARTLLQWSPRDFGEGNDPFPASQGAFNEGYRFAYESGWEYNQSQSRVINASSNSYSNSCVGYSGAACSNTNFQGNFPCYLSPTSSFCIRQLPTVTDRSDVTIPDPVNVWSQERDANQNTAILVLRAVMGLPTVLSFKVPPSFDNPDANGFITDSSFGQTSRGQHVALITGFIFDSELQKKVPNAPLADGDGYFIMKNSWGCAFGDAGYVYVPQGWVQRYAVGANGY